MIERLALHFPAMNRTDREHDLVNADLLEDLGDVPPDLLAEACRLWRTSGERWFPTSGQLRAKVEPILAHRKALARRAAAVIAAGPFVAVEPPPAFERVAADVVAAFIPTLRRAA